MEKFRILNLSPQDVMHGCKGAEKFNTCEQDMLAFDCFLTADVDMSIKKDAQTSSVWNKTLHNLLTVSCTAKKPKCNINHKNV